MALPTNTFRPLRYFRSKFREGKYLLAAEATDIQLETFEDLRRFILNTYGDVAVGPAFRPDQISTTEIRLRPGEAWDGGVPFQLKSGTDARVVAGVLPTGVTLVDTSAGALDTGGKSLDLSGGLTDGSYSVVMEAYEEIVKEAGAGAVDGFLEGVNVGEGTQHKFRLVYKVNVVETSDLTQTPTYPLSGAGIDYHYVNEINLTPSASENYLVSSIDITPDVNGADRRIVLNNSASNIPFSVDAEDFIFGTLEDSDGNLFTITSISTSDGGATVTMLLDREVDINTNVPKAGLPVITNGVDYKIKKRDFFVTDATGVPEGKRFFRVADFTFATGALTGLTDLRTVTEINSFGTDPNARLSGGGEISWSLVTNALTHSQDFDISLPGLAYLGSVPTPPGSITLASDGDVAYILLDREATADYSATATVVPKADVPSSVDVYVVAERRGSRVYFPHNGSIGDGETGILGAFGAAFNKDLSLDLLTDAITENQVDEVFAETFDTQNYVDSGATIGMNFEPFLKRYVSTTSARFVDYDADVLPAADPQDPWTKVGAQVEAVAAGILTLTDSSIGDQIAYTRTESNLVPDSQNVGKMRARITAEGGTGNPFTYEVRDGTSGKHFGFALSTTAVDLIDGSGASLATYALDGTLFHTYELQKIGQLAVQLWVDGELVATQDYSSISTGSGGSSDIAWGTTVTATATVELDWVIFNIYQSILQTVDIFKTVSVFYPGDTVPASDPDNPWTVQDGGGGISEATSGGRLTITDNIGTNRIAYERSEAKLARHGNLEVEMRVEIETGGLSSFDTFGLRFADGAKDIAAYIRDVAGQLKVGLYDGSSVVLRSSEIDLNNDEEYVIKIVKTRDEECALYVDGVLRDQASYDSFKDITTDKKIYFGGFTVASQYVANIDWVQYALPGDGSLAKTPVIELLASISGDDPAYSVFLSTDGGTTWFEAPEREFIEIADKTKSGASLIARIALSTISSTLTDFGVYYNRTDLAQVEALDVGQIIYRKVVSNSSPIPTGATYIEVSGSGTRALDDGATAGQMLILTGETGGGTAITIQAAGTNVQMPSDVTLNEYDSIGFIWNGTYWVELHRSNN